MKINVTSLIIGLMSVSFTFSVYAADPVPGPVPLPVKKSADINDPTHACAALVTACKNAKLQKDKAGDIVKNCVYPIAESKGSTLPKGVDAKKLSGQSEATYSSCQAALKTK